MTDDQWGDIVAMLRHWWPGEFTDAAGEGYRMLLGQHEAPDVAAVIVAAAQRGEKFRPAAAELLAAISPPRVFVSPEEAWSLIERAVHRVGCSIYHDEFPARHQAAVDWLREQDEAVAAWAAQRGLCGPRSLGAEPVNDPQHGGAVRHRLLGDFVDIAARAQDRVARGLPAFEDRQFVLAGARGKLGMQEMLEHWRPAQALGAGGPS